MIDPVQLRKYVVRPVLEHIGYHSAAAEDLLIGTAAHESAMGRYLHQLGGPAVGIYQMEPATHDDICRNYLVYRPALADAVAGLQLERWAGVKATAGEMAGNLYYATAMCRVHYLRVPEPLPPAGAVEAMARYWKAHYNTHLGAGSEEQFVDHWRRYVG